MILYKRNQNEVPIYWGAYTRVTGEVVVAWGIVGKNQTELVVGNGGTKQLRELITAKKKEGYMELYSVRDETPQYIVNAVYTLDNVADSGAKDLEIFLNTYLPKAGIFADGTESVMLAKLFDFDAVAKKSSIWLDQPKINGERCTVTVRERNTMFEKYQLQFWSRLHNEFVYLHPEWARKLLNHIPPKLFDKMLSGEVTLDGELYIPGRPINEINHVIKSPNMALKDKLDLQFWLYDLMWEGVIQKDRLNFINPLIENDSKLTWLNGKNLDTFQKTQKHILVYLGYWLVEVPQEHIILRNRFIKAGFEGVILRDYKALYQYGKRNMTMIKYKQVHEGKFEIVDVISEGKKRPDFGILVCQNDINEERFTCTYAAPFMMKRDILANRDAYIGAYANVEFRERSGVKAVPFHAQCVTINPR
jgi:hypothetical protein